MSVIVPRAQSGVSVAPQATENAAVSETDVDYDNDLTIAVRTFAGQQDVSRQTLERGTAEIDRLIFADLVAAYGARLDSSIINDDGTAGTHKGVRSATHASRTVSRRCGAG
jgi:HK97 family phage major capsid protein